MDQNRTQPEPEHHLALSIFPDLWRQLKSNLNEAIKNKHLPTVKYWAVKHDYPPRFFGGGGQEAKESDQ